MAFPEIDVRAGDTIIESLQKDLEKEKLELPVLPAVVTNIIREIASSEVNIETVQQILSEDSHLSARLLQICNISLFNPGRPVENLAAAISWLGYSRLRTLLVCLSLESFFHHDEYRVDAALQALWQHSCEVAAISAVLAFIYLFFFVFLRPPRGEPLLPGLFA